MSDWNNDVFPWSDPSDPWVRRSYIGDWELPLVEAEGEERIACFYDSDGQCEQINLSDLSSEDEDSDERSTARAYPRVCLRRTRRGYFYTIIAR